MGRVCLWTFFFYSVFAVAPPLGAQPVDTIRVGSPELAGVRLRLGSEAVESFVLRDGVRIPNSTTTRTIGLERRGGTDVYVIRSVHASAHGDTTHSTMVVRASDFALVRHKVKAEADSAAVTAVDGQLTGWVVLPEQPVQLVDVELAHAVFPVEGQMPWLFPLLPLRAEYRAALPHFSQWEGREVWTEISVTGSEFVEHHGTMLECWIVDTGEFGPPGYRGFHWVSKDQRQILQSVLRGSGDGPQFWAVARDG